MASINDYVEFTELCKTGVRGGVFEACITNGSWAPVGYGMSSAWFRLQNNNNSGVYPTTQVSLNSANPAALLRKPSLPGVSTQTLWISELELAYMVDASNYLWRIGAFLYDRLGHQGGLSSIVTTEQTTNLPTAPLTRYTSGEGVMVGLELHGAIGSTATTATIKYTNQDGVSGRTSLPLVVGGTLDNPNNIIRFFSLQDGDTGVRSVESFTLAASTGTAANMGICLMKPLGMFPVDSAGQTERTSYKNLLFGGGVIEVHPDACLALLLNGVVGTTGVHSLVGRIGIASK